MVAELTLSSALCLETTHVIDTSVIDLGDIVTCKRGTKFPECLYTIPLPLALKHYYPEWDMWDWHTMPIINLNPLQVLSAEPGGVRIRNLSDYPEYRIYRWLPNPPEGTDVAVFVSQRLGCGYDFTAYPLAALQRVVINWWHMPRILNSRYYCWELTDEFCTCFGRPWPGSAEVHHLYPLLPEFRRQAGRPIAVAEKGG
ncbi:MAG: hypothetical protein PHU08_00010 [Dehalococcoidales bacterium]|nr:hypothetical protein [Dehalococcoidales bacterium]